VPEGLKLPNPQVRAILIARDRTFWIGSQGGLVHYDPRTRRMLELPARAPSASVMALHEDRAGRIWVGTSEGLARITGDEVAEFGPAQGFPGEAVFAFLEEAPDVLWIGSDAGLVHHQNERFSVLGPAQGLPFYSVLGVQRDAAGSFWLASGSGVLRLPASEVEAALADRTHKLGGRQFNRDDGMPSSQCNGGSQPASLKLASGELWFATARGVAVVDPRTIDDRTPEPPNVVINRITVDDRDVPLDQPQALGQGRHTIAVQFAAIALSRQGQVDDAWRVRGLDEHWEFIGSERSVRLTTIPAGDYTLEVAARYGHGALSVEPARFSFSVAPMLWQRPWFIALAALVTGLAIVAIVQRRTAALRARGAELTRLVAEKTVELERLAREDGLTHVCNRRHFDERLNELVASARASGGMPALVMFDLDHFKAINDERSHHVGDLVLKRFAQLLREAFPDGVVGRYGGEEFIAALPATDRAGAHARADALRRRVEIEPWDALDAGLAVTVSAGVAGADSGDTAAQLIRAADARLYEAKRSGRNRVV
jgi:diguanylate cyclase (GGDEF)-like protein